MKNAVTGYGGEGGIRTPEPLQANGFQDRRIQPLCHLSVATECSVSKGWLAVDATDAEPLTVAA
jgi:hypothetical protein